MDHVQSIDVQAGKIEDLEIIIEDITRVLRQKHDIADGKEDDFYVQNSAQFLRSWEDSAKTFTYLLGGIAAISAHGWRHWYHEYYAGLSNRTY